MIDRPNRSLLIRPCDIVNSSPGFEVIGVFNPAVAQVGQGLIMLVRVAERPIEKRAGFTALPRISISEELQIDWVPDLDLHIVDARVVQLRASGNLRLTSVSHLQVFRSVSLEGNRWEYVSSIQPEGGWEEYGIEDPRITKIDNSYWITYVAVSKSGAATALMSSTDLRSFNRHGIVFPSENKDVVLFPRTIGDDFVVLHRPNPRSHFQSPQIWLARSPDMVHWGRHEVVLQGTHAWESDRVGSGTPPILCDEGWLLFYHGSARSVLPGIVGTYSIGVLLLDRNQPARVLARSNQPIMQPIADFEVWGVVPNVVFPTGIFHQHDDLQIFYGAADTCVASVRFSLREILQTLQPNNYRNSK